MKKISKGIYSNQKIEKRISLVGMKIFQIRKLKGKFKCGFCGKFHPFKEYHRYHSIESWKANGSPKGMKPL